MSADRTMKRWEKSKMKHLLRPFRHSYLILASAGLAAFGKYKLGGLVQIGSLFTVSKKFGDRMAGEMA